MPQPAPRSPAQALADAINAAKGARAQLAAGAATGAAAQQHAAATAAANAELTKGPAPAAGTAP